MNRHKKLSLIVFLLFSLTLAVATERISVDSAGSQGNAASVKNTISADGRFVAFESMASNLVIGDTNMRQDIFVHDRQTNTTERISVDSAGNQGNNSSNTPSISANGRFVAFVSVASNLVADDTNMRQDIFVHDRQNNTTERISVDSAGNQGNNNSNTPSISADGRFIAFVSGANNLVAGDTNGAADIFVYDRDLHLTKRVSVDGAGIQADDDSDEVSISANGLFVVFMSVATNLVAGDTNDLEDIFVYSLQTDTIERVSIGSAGDQGNDWSNIPAISADGRFVAFASRATNMVANDTNNYYDIFVRDRQTGTLERVSVDSSGAQSNAASYYTSISADGRFVTFVSTASNLVLNDTNATQDVFIHDRQTGVTERVSIDSAGGEANDESNDPVISADGRFVIFSSYASNLVAGDTNNSQDVFIYFHSIKAAMADAVPTMSASLLITLIGLVGGMALLVRGRSSRSA